MVYSRYVATVGLVFLLVLASASAALAVPCGQPAKGSTEPTVGELALDTNGSDDPSLPSFKGKTDKKDIAFSFAVSGCTLGSSADIKVRTIGDEADAVSLAAEPKGDVLIVTGTVDPKKFEPGTHNPTVSITSPSGLVKSQRFKVALERKEPAPLPAGLSLVAAILGLVYAFFVARQAAIDAYDKKKAEAAKKTPPRTGFLHALLLRKGERGESRERKVRYGGIAPWLGVVVGAAIAAAAAFSTGYIKSATWSMDFPEPFLLMGAVAAATAGGAAAGLAKAVTARELPKPESKLEEVELEDATPS
jgi:hypothetical protein